MATVGIGDLRQLSVGHILKLERQLVSTREPVPAAVATEGGAVTTTPNGTDPTTTLSTRDVAVTRATSLMAVSTKAVAEVAVTVKVNVARSPEEAELQSQGVDVIDAMFDSDDGGFTEAYDPNAEPGEIPVDLLEDSAAEAGA
jgi:hypothetical protein